MARGDAVPEMRETDVVGLVGKLRRHVKGSDELASWRLRFGIVVLAEIARHVAIGCKSTEG